MTRPTEQAVERAARAEPLWSEEALSRLLGAIDGYAHSIVAIRQMAGTFDSSYCGRFPKHHTRKIERRDAIVKPLREVAARLEADMRQCQAAYQRQRSLIEARTNTESEK